MFELFFAAAWKVLVAGLLLGAGIPALFALGVRFTATGTGGEAMIATSTRPNPAFKALGAVCFVIAAILLAAATFMFIRSRLAPVTAGNVNDEWEDAPAAPQPTSV